MILFLLGLFLSPRNCAAKTDPLISILHHLHINLFIWAVADSPSFICTTMIRCEVESGWTAEDGRVQYPLTNVESNSLDSRACGA
jgi:hypothetical protein